MRSGGRTSCSSWNERTAGSSGGPDGGVEARASPAAPPPMVSVNANGGSRADLKGRPKFGLFFETEI